MGSVKWPAGGLESGRPVGPVRRRNTSPGTARGTRLRGPQEQFQNLDPPLHVPFVPLPVAPQLLSDLILLPARSRGRSDLGHSLIDLVGKSLLQDSQPHFVSMYWP